MPFSPPPVTRCPYCETWASEAICHICKKARPSLLETQQNAYVDAMMKKDQRERLEGRTTQRRGDSGGETSTDGRPIFPGS